MCQSLFSQPQAWNFIKKENLAQMFFFESCKMFYNTFFTEHLRTTASVEETAYTVSKTHWIVQIRHGVKAGPGPRDPGPKYDNKKLSEQTEQKITNPNPIKFIAFLY